MFAKAWRACFCPSFSALCMFGVALGGRGVPLFYTVVRIECAVRPLGRSFSGKGLSWRTRHIARYCFDLDGTLCPMELDEFLGGYFKDIARFAAEQGIDGEKFARAFGAGASAMAKREPGGKTNYDVFWDAFFAVLDRDAADWDAMFAGYYETRFGAIGADVQPNPAAHRALELLVAKGYPLVLRDPADVSPSRGRVAPYVGRRRRRAVSLHFYVRELLDGETAGGILCGGSRELRAFRRRGAHGGQQHARRLGVGRSWLRCVPGDRVTLWTLGAVGSTA